MFLPTTGCLLTDLTALFITLLAILLTYLKFWHFKYWQRKNISFVEPNIIFGNMKDMFFMQKSSAQIFKKCYDELKGNGAKVGGLYFFTRPVLMAIDPELIKNIMVRDFHHFMDRGGNVVTKNDPLADNLLSLKGQKWRELRAKLTPTFTSGKMKFMFQTLVDCSEELDPVLDELIGQPIDIKEIVARYTTDVIGSCAFGVECNSLKNPNSEFRNVGRMALEFTTFRAFKRIGAVIFPKICELLGISPSIPFVVNFFENIVKETVECREKKQIVRKDFMDLMIKLKNEGSLDAEDAGQQENKVNELSRKGLTMQEITGQSFLFFAAGFETSSTALTFCFYELTQNLDVQVKLREEIRSVLSKHDEKITYESLMEMKYMDNVINETFRKHPPVPQVARFCTEEYKIPDSNICIKPGTRVFIPIAGLHNDPEYYPIPERFDPDRFTEENKKARHPFTHLPFGEGPRNCIGLRFGLMQIKVALVVLVGKYKWALSPKTIVPLRSKPQSFLNATRDPVWLLAEKL